MSIFRMVACLVVFYSFWRLGQCWYTYVGVPEGENMFEDLRGYVRMSIERSVDTNLTVYAYNVLGILNPFYPRQHWGVVTYKRRQPTSPTAGVRFIMDSNCDLPVPPQSCARSGGSLIEVATPRGTNDFIAVVVIFVPLTYVTDDEARLRSVMQGYQTAINGAIVECVTAPLTETSNFSELIRCLRDEIVMHHTHDYAARFVGTCLIGMTGNALHVGGVMATVVPDMNVIIYVLPPRELMLPRVRGG